MVDTVLGAGEKKKGTAWFSEWERSEKGKIRESSIVSTAGQLSDV